MTDHTTTRSAGWPRLAVPAVAVLLVAVALNASWHAIQATLVAVDAPAELVIALPAVLEPAALIYAWVTIDRARTGRDVTGVRWLLAAAVAAAVAFNIASALPLDTLMPAGSTGRMLFLAVSAALAPLTVVSVGHTALVEYAAWRAARRSLVDDVHAALEAEAQQALSGQLRGEFAAEVHAAVLTRLRAEMADRLNLPTTTDTVPDAVAVPATAGHDAGHEPVSGGRGVAAGGRVTVTTASHTTTDVAWADVPAVARPVIADHLAAGGHVADADLTAAVSATCDVSDRTARRWLAPVRTTDHHGDGDRLPLMADDR